MNSQLGSALKKIRLSNSLTLQKLANLTDLSAAYLSLVERGLTSITICNLQKLCFIFKITMSGLLSSAEQNFFFVKEKNRRPIYTNKHGLLYESTTEGDRNLTGVCLTITDNEDHESNPHLADELGTVISGSMNFTMNGQIYELHEGDTLYVPALTEHSFQKTSRKECVSLWVYHATAKNSLHLSTPKISTKTKTEGSK